MSVVDEFHKLYYGPTGDNIYGKTYYMGIETQKCPLDLWIYQEIIWEYKPEFIIETGSYRGGSALFLAHTVDNFNLPCFVFSVDINNCDYPEHNYLQFITGSSIDPQIIDYLSKVISKNRKTVVILDSDHSKSHVLNELNLYKQFIKPGGYIIVEDTNVNGHPVREDWGEGPQEAVVDFLKHNSDFEIDKSKEKFLMTFNPNGYLRRKV